MRHCVIVRIVAGTISWAGPESTSDRQAIDAFHELFATASYRRVRLGMALPAIILGISGKM
jgi:hypothetical protein